MMTLEQFYHPLYGSYMKITVTRPNFETRVFDDADLTLDEDAYQMNTTNGVLEIYRVGMWTEFGTPSQLVFACTGQFDAIQE